MNPTDIVKALAPAFAAGLAIQHANELLDPLVSKIAGSEVLKKTYMGWLSLLFGALVTGLLQVRVISVITGAKTGSDGLDFVVTALVISTGTEGVNSIIKFLGYAKDQKKAAAAAGESAAGAAIQKVNREP